MPHCPALLLALPLSSEGGTGFPLSWSKVVVGACAISATGILALVGGYNSQVQLPTSSNLLPTLDFIEFLVFRIVYPIFICQKS